jgi:hypothetical protein
MNHESCLDSREPAEGRMFLEKHGSCLDSRKVLKGDCLLLRKDPVLILEKLLKGECLLCSMGMGSCLDSGEDAEGRVLAIKHGFLS